MRNRQGCFFGLGQFIISACVTGFLLTALIGGALGAERISFAHFLQGFSRPANSQLVRIEPVTYEQAQVKAPTATTMSQPATAPVVQIMASVQAPLTFTPTPIPTTRPDKTATPTPSATATPVIPAPTPQASNISQVSGETGWQATRLVIPIIKLDVPVLFSPIEGETWKVDHLDQAVGHLDMTASPGDSSNVVLAGHVTLAPDGRAGPFRNLGYLEPGDLITVYRNNQPFTYEVDYLDTVKPSDIQVTYPSDDSRLTLLTCLNYDQTSGRYTDRLVVVSHLLKQ